MLKCFFVSDLHGVVSRYEKLTERIITDRPAIVLMGGDLLPHGFGVGSEFSDFFSEFLFRSFIRMKEEMQEDYPEILLILGNDDPKVNEIRFVEAQKSGLWRYMHKKKYDTDGFAFYGYAHVPPTPFRLKDWERYDVSRYVDPGCIHPAEGYFSMEPEEDIEFSTIQKHLAEMTGGRDLSGSVFLFHSPPYGTHLDRAALDGRMIDHVPLDVHVGSIAIQRFIEERQPLMTLHGHIHEASRITGDWHQYIGKTLAVNAAWEGPELSLISFDLEDPATVQRELI
ncbi:MAG: metallophosphoesterase [Bacteroidales bacterium]